jgi:hypothetical protein
MTAPRGSQPNQATHLLKANIWHKEELATIRSQIYQTPSMDRKTPFHCGPDEASHQAPACTELLFLGFFVFGVTDVGHRLPSGKLPPNVDHWKADDIYM